MLLEGRKPRELTAAALRDIMNFEFTGEPGSNNRMAQETVAQGWIMFLQASEGNYTECMVSINQSVNFGLWQLSNVPPQISMHQQLLINKTKRSITN